MRFLIVNADDFGRSPGINRGIVRAHREGIVTSASLMVRWPAATAAAALADENPALSVGLHLDLCEWVCRDGAWTALYEVVSTDDERAVRDEVARQLDGFRRLLGRDPTHLDSHQHVHRREPVAAVLASAARELGVPLRHFDPGIRYCGDFFGQTRDGLPLPEYIGAEHLVRLLRALPEGVTELACHPAEGDDCRSSYGPERALELEALRDPRVAEAVVEAGIRLRSFHPADRDASATPGADGA